MKILYIDDEKDLLKVIPCYFDNHSWTLADDLNSGLHFLQVQKFDLVIVDFLPDLGSIKIIEKCDELGIEVVLFTGHANLIDIPIKHVVIKPGLVPLLNIVTDIQDLKKAA